jgi:hypothetical protein
MPGEYGISMPYFFHIQRKIPKEESDSNWLTVVSQLYKIETEFSNVDDGNYSHARSLVNCCIARAPTHTHTHAHSQTSKHRSLEMVSEF